MSYKPEGPVVEKSFRGTPVVQRRCEAHWDRGHCPVPWGREGGRLLGSDALTSLVVSFFLRHKSIKASEDGKVEWFFPGKL